MKYSFVFGSKEPTRRRRTESARPKSKRRKRPGELLATGATVRLYEIKRDKYPNRLDARIVGPEGVDVAAQLIAEELAVPYEGGRRRQWCNR